MSNIPGSKFYEPILLSLLCFGDEEQRRLDNCDDNPFCFTRPRKYNNLRTAMFLNECKTKMVYLRVTSGVKQSQSKAKNR